MSKDKVRTITMMENRSKMRKNFIRKRFTNGVDLIRFYFLVGRMAAFPVLGTIFIKPIFNLYHRYFDSNSMILPLEEVEAIIMAAETFFVDPCDCRLEFEKCDAPLYTCLRLNFAAEIREEDTGKKGITREEALKIAENAAKHGLVFCLEQCIQPYAFNICMCCSCCCIQHRFRYELGLQAFNTGPYVPYLNSEKCAECGKCIETCNAGALAMAGKDIELSMEKCSGCGNCACACPENAINMIFEPEKVRNDTEPGWMRLVMIRCFMYLYMFPMSKLYKLFWRSHQYKVESAAPRKKDIYLP